MPIDLTAELDVLHAYLRTSQSTQRKAEIFRLYDGPHPYFRPLF